MILQDLVKYYDILASDPNSGVPLNGYGVVKVDFAALINKNGDFIKLQPLRQTINIGSKTKEIKQVMTLFEPVKKTNNPKSNFLFENPSYFLGVDKDDKPDKTLTCFEIFRDFNKSILKNVNCIEAQAITAFLDKHPIEFFQDNDEILNHWSTLIKGGNIIFEIEDVGYAHESPEINEAWMDYKTVPSGAPEMQCLVTGEIKPIALTHPILKNIKGAQSSGAYIVSFNERAYESYGKTKMQGLNAPISEQAAFAYTTVLNRMTASKNQKIQLGDTTIVFWAENSSGVYENIIMNLLQNGSQDPTTEQQLKKIFDKIQSCEPIEEHETLIDPETTIHILGIVPNKTRLAISLYYKNKFGSFVDSINQHYKDLQIQKEFESQPDFIPLWVIMNELISPKTKEGINPIIANTITNAILSNQQYPAMMLSSVLNRIKMDNDDADKHIYKINYTRVSIIKAFLTRKYKRTQNNIKETLTMSLNEQADNKAYLLGRIFAILEKVQLESHRTGNHDPYAKLNRTIKDRYFSSACTSPASVFPTLLKLAQHHISKATYGYISDNKIRDILDMLPVGANAFPKRLTPDEQGVFVLGYYHQKQDFYKKKAESQDTSENLEKEKEINDNE